MALERCVTEMGMGVDVHGRDYTLAARRAVSDAIRHSSLSLFRAVGKTRDDVQIKVVIGVPEPEKVDLDAVARELPYGQVTVTAQKGGLEVPNAGNTDAIVIANAAGLVVRT
ncbi:MAG: Lin0512 family protein [Alphaproteobacteria bacterium]|nr:Lin0512 family protein [Alphaproteobacteria bacterium]